MSDVFNAENLKALYGNFNAARKWSKKTYGVTARDCLTPTEREERFGVVCVVGGDDESDRDDGSDMSIDITPVQIVRWTLWRSLFALFWLLRDFGLDCVRTVRWAYSQCLMLCGRDAGAGLMYEVGMAFRDLR